MEQSQMSNEYALIKTEAAHRAIIEAKSVDELKDIRDKAEAIRLYAKQAHLGIEMINDCTEIKLRAERKMGVLLKETEKATGGQPYQKKVPTGNVHIPVGKGIPPTLEDLGVSKAQSSRAQKLAEVPEDKFEQYIAETKAKKEELTTVGVMSTAANRHTSDDTYEWYTPSEYIEAVRRVIGSIDLDPASCAQANEVVKAKKFYTLEDDGLSQPWHGKIWLNPPYNMPLVELFTNRAIESYKANTIEQAVVIVNNATDTSWFHALLTECGIMCLPRGRVKFWGPDGEATAGARQGQVLFYLGKNKSAFAKEFGKLGIILKVYHDN